jgi:hypothetical protein
VGWYAKRAVALWLVPKDGNNESAKVFAAPGKTKFSGRLPIRFGAHTDAVE